MGRHRRTRRTDRVGTLAKRMVAECSGSARLVEGRLLLAARRVVRHRGPLGERVSLHFVALCLALHRLSARRFGVLVAPHLSDGTPIPTAETPESDPD